MKKAIIAIALAALLAGCAPAKDANAISWQAFCEARGYNASEKSEEVINEYHDTWCGSSDEESALEVAGVEIIEASRPWLL